MFPHHYYLALRRVFWLREQSEHTPKGFLLCRTLNRSLLAIEVGLRTEPKIIESIMPLNVSITVQALFKLVERNIKPEPCRKQLGDIDRGTSGRVVQLIIVLDN